MMLTYYVQQHHAVREAPAVRNVVPAVGRVGRRESAALDELVVPTVHV